jgi:hypothetical protein
MGQHFFVGGAFFDLPCNFAFELAEHDKFVRVSLLASAIDFQIAQDQCPFAVALKENERIGRPKSASRKACRDQCSLGRR